MLFEPGGSLADRLFLGVGEVNLQDQRQPCSQFAIASGLRTAVSPFFGDFEGSPAARNHAFDSIPDHEFDAARIGAKNGLPTFHRLILGAWHQGDFFEWLAAMLDLGRELVVGTAVGEGGFVPGFENDLDLLLEEFAIGRVVFERATQSRQLAGDISSADAEAESAPSENIGEGDVLGQSQRVPGRDGIEHAAVVELCGVLGQIDSEHWNVGDPAVALALEVVLGEPQGIVAGFVHQLGHRTSFGENRSEVFVRFDTLVGR